MALVEQDSLVSTPLGQTLRIPCKFIKGKSDAQAIQIKAIAAELKSAKKNIVPVVIRFLEEDVYEAILNIQILEAARQAKMDFVWCIVVDEAMQSQALIEAGQLLRVNIATADEQEIRDIFEYIKLNKTEFSRIVPHKVAQAIVEYRQLKDITTLTFLTRLKCGIGKARLKALQENLFIN